VNRRKRALETLDRDIRDHIERETQDNVDRGMSPEEARQAAYRRFGNILLIEEEARAVWSRIWLEQALQDIRYALRTLARNPGFTTVVIVTLALGIGANTAIFGLVNKVLIDSLPIARPHELVLFHPQGIRNGWTAGDMTLSYPSYLGFCDRQQVFTGVLAERTDTVNFRIDGATQRATETIVSGNYFEVLGVSPFIGRVLTPEDDREPGGHPVAVLSHGFWVEKLGGRRDIVGQTIRLNGFPFTVVGVSEKGFNGLEVGRSIDVVVPASMLAQVVTYGKALTTRIAYIFNVYGRLKPGIGRAEAAAQMQSSYLAELEADVAEMGAQAPTDQRWREGKLLLDDARRGVSRLRDSLSTPLTALMAMTGIVLVIACANIAGLLLARSAARAKEISIRLAIGASAGRIVRQMLTETAILTLFGGVSGLVVTRWTINLVLAQTGDAERLKLETTFFDWRLLAFALATCVATAVFFGLLPAMRASRESVSDSLKTAVASDRTAQLRLRKILVTAQVALGLVLVTGAGLFLRTLNNLRHVHTGFRTDQLVQFNLNAGLAGYDPSRAATLFARLLEDVRALPGVRDVTLSVAPVLSGGDSTIGFGLGVEGYKGANGERAFANGNAVAPGYFSALGLTLLRGRDFSSADVANSPRVAVVSESFVQRYFPSRDPLGLKISLGWGLGAVYQHEIVGISKDARVANLRDEPYRSFYIPYTQWNVLSQASLIVRTSAEPSTLGPAIRDLVKRHDANIPVVDFRPIDEQIDRLLRPERLAASLSLMFGLLATGLAAMGIYGVTAFSVARRRGEIGIRMALGASRGNILRMVIRDVAAMAAVGIIAGVALSLGLSGYVESQLYGIAPRDVATILASVILLVIVSLASAWLPARRATRVDPTVALRG
jgi:predicted permease